MPKRIRKFASQSEGHLSKADIAILSIVTAAIALVIIYMIYTGVQQTKDIYAYFRQSNAQTYLAGLICHRVM